jgi:hypothetical protein
MINFSAEIVQISTMVFGAYHDMIENVLKTIFCEYFGVERIEEVYYKKIFRMYASGEFRISVYAKKTEVFLHDHLVAEIFAPEIDTGEAGNIEIKPPYYVKAQNLRATSA